ARLLRQWVLSPLSSVEGINARLDAVGVLAEDSRSRERLRDALDGVRDLERLAGRAAAGRATPREMAALRDSLARLPDVLDALRGMAGREASRHLASLEQQFDLHSELS